MLDDQPDVAAAALEALCRLHDPRASRLFLLAVQNRQLESVYAALPKIAMIDDGVLDALATLVDGRIEFDPGDQPFRVDASSDRALNALGRAGPAPRGTSI